MEITPELIVAMLGFILGVGNIVAARRKSLADARGVDADAAKKLSDTAANLAGEIQTHVVDELKRQLTVYSERIDRLEILAAHQEEKIAEQGKRLADQDTTIKEQGGVIMQLRDRVTHLETENGNLKAENAALKSRGGKL